ncbi:hypothetical protein LTR29_013266 [Friedmanniomyces endolithicus]|nr:hypothetical protein LTR29_013266 [Friedmanniomyces endolithicus]
MASSNQTSHELYPIQGDAPVLYPIGAGAPIPRGFANRGSTSVRLPWPADALGDTMLLHRGKWFRALQPHPFVSKDVLRRIRAGSGRNAAVDALERVGEGREVWEGEWKKFELPSLACRQTNQRPKYVDECLKAVDTAMCSKGDRQCRLLALPDELLLRVREYLVPTSGGLDVIRTVVDRSPQINHIAKHPDPLASGGGGGAGGANEHIHLNGLACARTCRRMDDVFCSILYGRKKWLLDLSDVSQTLPPVVALPPGYVRDLLILVTPQQWRLAAVGKSNALRVEVEGVLALFEEGDQLRSLAVDVAFWHVERIAERQWFFGELGPGGNVTLKRLLKPGEESKNPVGVEDACQAIEKLRQGVRLLTLQRASR